MSKHSDSQPEHDDLQHERLDSIIADFIRLSEAGGSPDRLALLRQHPEFAPELEQFFAQRDRMNRLVDPIREFGDDLYQSIGPGKHLSYVGNYELLEEVARGGMGVVYKARQATLGRFVAVKMIVSGRLATEQDVQRFQSEAQAAASLQHPNIVSIHEVGQHEGWHYFSMDYVEGRDLSTILRLNPLPAKTAAIYVRQMAEAIHYAHNQGVLHRDLKPSNILIDSHDQVRITDFGLALRVESNQDLTQTGQIVGTPSYMPPEQAQCNRALIGPASDVYALGAVLYESLTGRPPFRAESVIKTLDQVIHAEAVSPHALNSSIPRDLETICLKCLEKEPHKRYGTAQLLADDLGRFLSGEPILARRVGTLSRAWRWCRRKPVVAGLSAVSVLAVALTIIVLVYSREIIAIALADRTTALGNLKIEQGKTLDALAQRTDALGQKIDTLNRLSIEERKVRDALVEKSAALKRERITAYAQTLTLARREWLEGNLTRTLDLLNTCHPDLRHWEWHYLRRICEPASLYTAASAAGMSGSNRMPITLDGKSLLVHHAATNAAEELVVTDASTGATTSRFRSPGESLGQIAVSGDGQLMLNGSSKKMGLLHTSYIELRETQGGKSVFKADLPDFSLEAIAVDADGARWAVSGSVWQHGAQSTRDWEVRLWKRESPDTPTTLSAKTNSTRTLLFSPDKTRLLTCHRSGFEMWETAGFTQIAADVLPPGSAANSFFGALPCFRGEGTQFAYAAGNSVVVYDTATGAKVRTFYVDKPAISAVAFGDGDRKLAYGTVHGNVVLLDLQSGREDVLLRLPQAISQVDFSPDGSRLVTLNGQRQLQIWDAVASPESDAISGHAGHSFTAAFDRSGGLVATVGEHNKVRIWDVVSKQLKREISPFKGEVYDVAFSATGTQLATAGHEGIQVWNLETGDALHRFTIANEMPMGFGDRVEFARQDNWLVGGHERGATIWDLCTGLEVRSFGVGKGSDWLSCARLSADGSRLATCGHEGNLQLWDTDTGRELFKVEEEDTLYTLTFSPDEKQILACGLDKDILIVDAITGAEVQRLSGHAQGANTVAFSNDGKRLVSAGRDGVIKIWDAETGLELLSFQGNERTCYSAAFSPDSRRLITTEIGLLRIWDAGVSPEDPNVRREMAAAHNALAADLMAKGRFRDAEEAYDQARMVVEKLATDFPETPLYRADLMHSHWSLASVQQANGRHREAEQSFSKAIELDAGGWYGWHRRAVFFASQGNVENAVGDYVKVLELNSNNVDAYNNLAWLLATCKNVKLRNPTRSVELAKKAIELSPSSGEFWNTLGVAQYRAGDSKGAIEALAKSMELRNGGDGFEFFFLAMIHWKLGDADTARTWYDKGVEWQETSKSQSEELQRFRAEAAETLGLNE